MLFFQRLSLILKHRTEWNKARWEADSPWYRCSPLKTIVIHQMGLMMHALEARLQNRNQIKKPFPITTFLYSKRITNDPYPSSCCACWSDRVLQADDWDPESLRKYSMKIYKTKGLYISDKRICCASADMQCGTFMHVREIEYFSFVFAFLHYINTCRRNQIN